MTTDEKIEHILALVAITYSRLQTTELERTLVKSLEVASTHAHAISDEKYAELQQRWHAASAKTQELDTQFTNIVGKLNALVT